MQRVGITGQSGFIGSFLFNFLGAYPEKFERVHFDKHFFEQNSVLDSFVEKCDIIVHLAAVNRHSNPEAIYQTNIDLTSKLINSLERTRSSAHVLFASSTQEINENAYGKSKKDSRHLLIKWADTGQGKFTGLIIPNVFGPFGHPFHNSVIATFCHQLTHNEIPSIDVDAKLKLIYVGDLVQKIEGIINENVIVNDLEIAYTEEIKVSDILKLLQQFKADYLQKGIIPVLLNNFDVNLFNTFRCYMDIENSNPIRYAKHTDERGSFAELVKLNIGGQVSFSVTLPGMTRGNHYHTRKIERFAVIKGDALIQLRKIGSTDVLNFYVSGNEPAFVDMPIWYTHNIKNIGSEDLYTVFWINEFYNNIDPDTFYETV